MKMLREPVIHVIENTAFVVEVAHQQLRQTNDQNNVISFTRDMQDVGTHYRLRYDLENCTVPTDSSDEQWIQWVNVPPMTELDPEGMALAYGKSLPEVLGKPDFEVIVDQQQLLKRHQGILPVIEIAAQPYIVDLHLKELRHLTDLSRSINLNKLDLTPEGDEYMFFYDVGKHVPVELDLQLTEFPDHVVLAKIPNEIGLDPVATAETYGIDEKQLLRRFPISPLKARLIPLADTGVPGLISRNREALRQEHRQIRQRQRRGQSI